MTNDQERLVRLSDLIREQTDVSPLDLLARSVLETGNAALARQIFSAYDEFLSVMIDPAARQALEKVPFEMAESDPTYGRLRIESREFRKGINSLFFDVHPKLKDLVREYGVF